MPHSTNTLDEHGKADGVLADSQIKRLITDKAITTSAPISPDQVQPASLDLRLGKTVYRMRASFLPGKNASVAEGIEQYKMHEMDISAGAILEKGCVYIAQLMERVDLPENIAAAANAKSSTGRLDLLTRTIVDNSSAFDKIAKGYSGPLYLEICPRSFSVMVRPGMQLNQIRFRIGEPYIADSALAAIHAQYRLVNGAALIDNGLSFSIDLAAKGKEPIGYRAKPHTGAIDIGKIAAYDASDFWEEVYSDSGAIILDPGAFYILKSCENVCIPPLYAAEMLPYLAPIGEFRVHYAGFFDPGFGFSEGASTGDASTGARAVLEMRCHEVPFRLEHGQSVGRLVYEKMLAQPEKLYGSKDLQSHYHGQSLKLSKHFKM